MGLHLGHNGIVGSDAAGTVRSLLTVNGVGTLGRKGNQDAILAHAVDQDAVSAALIVELM